MATVSPGRTMAASNRSHCLKSGPRLRVVRTSYAVPFPALCAVSVKTVRPVTIMTALPVGAVSACASASSTHETVVRSHHLNAMVTTADTNAARIATPQPEFNQSTATEPPTSKASLA